MGTLPPDGLGGRLLYQTTAFYGILTAIALRHSRLPYLLWGTTLALALLHGAFQFHALARWNAAFGQMRALVAEIDRVERTLAPGAYALVLVPPAVDDIPFARNAQGGLMLPPIRETPITSRLLVQDYDELPQLAEKIATGIVSTLRQRPVGDYLAGRRITTSPPEYPTTVLCFDAALHRLVALDATPGPDPQSWAQALRRELAASTCKPRASSR